MKKFIHDLTDNEKRALIGVAIGIVTIAIIAIMFLSGNKPKEIVSNEKKDPYSQSLNSDESSSAERDSQIMSSSFSSGSKNVWMTLDPSKTPEKKPEEKDVKVTAPSKSEHIVTPNEKSEESSKDEPEDSGKEPEGSTSVHMDSQTSDENKPKDNDNGSSTNENDDDNSGGAVNSDSSGNSAIDESQNNSDSSVSDEPQDDDSSEDNNWLIGNAIADNSPYIKQKLGATTTQQFTHPNEKMALDFSNNINLAKNAYVLPTDNGFVVWNRALVNLLNMSDSDILDADNQALEGAVIIGRISKEEKDELKKEEGIVYTFIEDGDSYVMVKGFPISDNIQKILSSFAVPSVNASTVASSVVANGELNTPSKLPANNDLEWIGLSSSLNKDPSRIEMAYNLPLYADSEKYRPNGVDIRKAVPVSQIEYYTGSNDINGDGVNEYLVHSTAVGEAGTGIQGYWAIFAPSKQGLVLAALSKYGNGGFVLSENKLYFISEAPEEDGIIVSLQSMEFPMKEDSSNVITLKFYLPDGFPSKWTGKQFADAYPGYMIVKSDDKYFAVNKEDFDVFIDTAKENLQSAKTIEILKDDKVVNEEIIDVTGYLDTITSVPFGKEWEKAISVDKLSEITENLTEEIIQKNN